MPSNRTQRPPHTFLPILILLAAACAGGGSAGTGGDDGYLHAYSETGRELLRFAVNNEMSMGMVEPMPFDMSMGTDTELSLALREAGEAWEAEITIDHFEMTGAAMEQLAMAGMGEMAELLELEGKSGTFPVEASGKVPMEISMEMFSGGFSAVSLQNYLQQLFIPWPDRRLRPGDTWTDTLRASTDEEMDMEMLQVTHYEYLGMQTAELEGESIEGHAVRRTTEMSMAGTTSVDEVSMEMTGTLNGIGTLYFDMRGGMLVYSVGDDQMTMEMTVFSPMQMTLPMDATYRTVYRRIR